VYARYRDDATCQTMPTLHEHASAISDHVYNIKHFQA